MPKSSTNKENIVRKIRVPRRKRWILILSGATAAIVLLALLTGYIQYGYYSAKCGRSPVMITRSWLGDMGGYFQKGDGYYKPGIFNSYYCTVQEAENDFFQPSPLSNEGLRRIEESSK